MTTKAKKERITTPIGEAMWAHVQTPKAAFTDERGQAKGEPKYQIDVVFDGEDPEWKAWASDLMKRVRALPVQTRKNPKTRKEEDIPHQIPIKEFFDQTDKPTGKFFVTFKTGSKFKPSLFDKYGRPIPENVLIGNGSKVRVNYSPSDYEGFGGGVALYLNAVQVVELVEYKAATADAYGFETEQPPDGDENPFNKDDAGDRAGDAQEPEHAETGGKIPF